MSRGVVGFPRKVDVEAGKFCQISHDNLPPRTPSWLKSIKVVLVSEKTKMKVTVKYPSLESLKKYISTGLTSCPSLDMSFIMGSELAKRVLLWQVAEPDFSTLEDYIGFWLLDSCLLTPKLEWEEVSQLSPKYLSASTIDYEEQKLDEVDTDEVKAIVVKMENDDEGFGSDGMPRKKRFKWWSEKSFEAGKGVIMNLLKEMKATAENPIHRADLRKVAQKQIGNTGLLDHLLKDVSGKLTPDGISRFQRCHNSAGVIVYWLESADSIDSRKKAGVNNPFRVPHTSWKLAACSTRCVCAKDLELLKQDMSSMKRDLEETMKQLNEIRARDISSGRSASSPDHGGWVGGFW